MKKKGVLDKQDIYAKIINYGVYHQANTQPVTEKTIGDAVNKAKKVMQGAVHISHSGQRWGNFNLQKVRTELLELTIRGEKEEGERY